MNNSVARLMQSTTDKLGRLNKKIDILATTARRSMDGRFCGLRMENFLPKENAIEVSTYTKKYKEWKQDLLLEYFNPKNYK